MPEPRLVYLDNAATTYPKPPAMLAEMVEAYAAKGVSPGRGGYDLAVEAGDLVQATRSALAALLGGGDPARVIFAANATDALNLAILGLVRPGGHVVSTRLEHNSVLRPLNHLKAGGVIDFDLVPFDGGGFIDPGDVARAIRPTTCLVVMTQASNVLGAVQPVAEVGRLCRERGLPLVVDAAQGAGLVPVDLAGWGASALAFTGHKALLGPSGVGGLVLAPDCQVAPTRFGGTGVDSSNAFQPEDYPHRLEAGTLNLLGILGLAAGLRFLRQEGLAAIHAREMALYHLLRQGLAEIRGVRLYGPPGSENRLGLLLFNVAGLDPADAGAILDADYGIAVRAGLHCAPLVHQDLGLGRRGGLRLSLGPFNTTADVETTIRAVAHMAARS